MTVDENGCGSKPYRCKASVGIKSSKCHSMPGK